MNKEFQIQELIVKGYSTKFILRRIFDNLVEKIKAQRIVKQYDEDLFVNPSNMDAIEFYKAAINFLRIATEVSFVAKMLSPLSPFGVNKVLTPISQKKIVCTNSLHEVNADATTYLAVIAISERKSSEFKKNVHLSTVCQCVRSQKFEKNSGFSQHFWLASLLSSGVNSSENNYSFHKISITNHILAYLQFLKPYLSQNKVSQVDLYISDISISEKIIKTFCLDRKSLQEKTSVLGFDLLEQTPLGINGKINVEKVETHLSTLNCRFSRVKNYIYLNEICSNFERVNFHFDLGRIAGIGYYSDICFKIVATNHQGETYSLADGGFVDWGYKLSNKKNELMLVSSFGMEVLQKYFDT